MAIDDNIPNSNASKNLDADGKPIYPSSYVFKEILLINKDGRSEDIQKIVTSLTIVEEIYSPLLTARIRIRDNENFFDDFKLNGQEIVRVKLEYLTSADVNSKRELTYEFVVRDYPLFDKTTESINVQEYDIDLVSSYAYLSRLQQISQSVVGNPITDGIKKIFETHLGNPTFEYKEENPCEIDKLKVVLTQQTPLQAVEFLKSASYDAKLSPFFIYTTLQDSTETGTKIIARSWSDITGNSNPVYDPLDKDQPYSLRPFGTEKPGTPEYLEQLKTKIIKFKSNIKLNKLAQAVEGGIGSTTEVVDLNERTYTEERTLPEDIGSPDYDFGYLARLKINGNPVDPKLIEKITSEPRTSREVYFIPVKPYDGEFKTVSEIKKEALEFTKLYKANMDSISHEIITYGDLNLKASAKIKIEIPKAVDTNEDTDLGIDEQLSGEYIIETSIHEFAGGVYTNQLKIIKETLNPKGEIAMNTTGQNFAGPIQLA